MKIYAVIDTNVIISALLSKHDDASTIKVIRAVLSGTIIPLYHQDILDEYKEVMSREKFHLKEETIQFFLQTFRQFGIEVFPQPSGETLIDMDDMIFYEVALEKRDDDAFLVTGNKKHYPIRDFIITPAEMIELLNHWKN